MRAHAARGRSRGGGRAALLAVLLAALLVLLVLSTAATMTAHAKTVKRTAANSAKPAGKAHERPRESEPPPAPPPPPPPPPPAQQRASQQQQQQQQQRIHTKSAGGGGELRGRTGVVREIVAKQSSASDDSATQQRATAAHEAASAQADTERVQSRQQGRAQPDDVLSDDESQTRAHAADGPAPGSAAAGGAPQGESGAGDDLLGGDVSAILIVKMDGSIESLDPRSGMRRWVSKIPGGRMVWNRQLLESLDTVYIPGLQGSIFYGTHGDALERLEFRAEQLLVTPRVIGDLLFQAKSNSSIFLVDPLHGVLPEDSKPMPDGAVAFLRKDVCVHATNKRTYEKAFELSTSTVTPVQEARELHESPYGVLATLTGLVAVVTTTGQRVWVKQMDAPVSVVFVVMQQGDIYPFSCVDNVVCTRESCASLSHPPAPTDVRADVPAITLMLHDSTMYAVENLGFQRPVELRQTASYAYQLQLPSGEVDARQPAKPPGTPTLEPPSTSPSTGVVRATGEPVGSSSSSAPRSSSSSTGGNSGGASSGSAAGSGSRAAPFGSSSSSVSSSQSLGVFVFGLGDDRCFSPMDPGDFDHLLSMPPSLPASGEVAASGASSGSAGDQRPAYALWGPQLTAPSASAALGELSTLPGAGANEPFVNASGGGSGSGSGAKSSWSSSLGAAGSEMSTFAVVTMSFVTLAMGIVTWRTIAAQRAMMKRIAALERMTKRSSASSAAAAAAASAAAAAATASAAASAAATTTASASVAGKGAGARGSTGHKRAATSAAVSTATEDFGVQTSTPVGAMPRSGDAAVADADALAASVDPIAVLSAQAGAPTTAWLHDVLPARWQSGALARLYEDTQQTVRCTECGLRLASGSDRFVSHMHGHYVALRNRKRLARDGRAWYQRPEVLALGSAASLMHLNAAAHAVQGMANAISFERIGDVLVSNHIIGRGSAGTVVFSGLLSGRVVAVKRLLVAQYVAAHDEMTALQKCDRFPNVLRYFSQQATKDFIFLALELCRCTLAELVAPACDNPMAHNFVERSELFQIGPHGLARPTPFVRTLLLQVIRGVMDLHSINVLHRDLKPHNILLTDDRTVKIGDMGLAREIDPDRSALETQPGGTAGWAAPETLVGRASRASDVFSVGCVMFYVLTGGHHPFGDGQHRHYNVVKGQYDLSALGDQAEARDLIERMICADPQQRIDLVDARRHPFFWDAETQLSYVVDVSDVLESLKSDNDLVVQFESAAQSVCSADWLALVDDGLKGQLTKHRSYKGNVLRDLLRVIRNKRHHYRDMPEDVQALVGPVPDGFLAYFLRRFPQLLVYLYWFGRRHLAAEDMLRKYFGGSGASSSS